MNFSAESISAVCQAVSDTVFPQIVKFKMAAIGHFQFVFLVIFIYNFLVWSPWYIEIYVGCIALGIWDMATIKQTRYVIERSWVRAPSGVCYFPPHKTSAVSRKFVCQPLQADIYTHNTHTYIHIWCIVLTIWYMVTINGIQNVPKHYK